MRFLNGPLSWTVLYTLVVKSVFFYIKRSRLVVIVIWSRFRTFKNKMNDHSKTGHKLCPENGYLNTGLSGIRTVTIYFTSVFKSSNKCLCSPPSMHDQGNLYSRGGGGGIVGHVFNQLWAKEPTTNSTVGWQLPN
jgi:hypothetical protein